MKYLFLALSFASIAACQDSGTDTDTGLKTGYVAGYQLTCGFSWKPGNGIVVEKEFARDFLDGAIMCARKHPKRARRVLGLPIAEKTVVAREPGHQPEASSEATEAKPVHEATGTPQKSAAHAEKPSSTPAKTAKKPASRPEPPKKTAKAPSKAKASSTTAKAPKQPPERKAKAPVKPKEAPVAASAAPAKAKAPVKTATPRPPAVTSAPKAKATPPAAESTPRRQERQRKPISDYQRFMGQ
jgi:hypothetical protein